MYKEKMKGISRYLLFFASIALAWGVSALSSMGIQPSIDGWYQGLAKSVLTPPNWVFPAVWSILYTLEGIAAWLILVDKKTKRRFKVGSSVANDAPKSRALALYLVQLVVVSLWTPIFFRFHLIGLSVAWIVLNLFLIWATIIAFNQQNKVAGLLLVPYGLWVAFAFYLNLTIYLNN